MRPSGRDGGRLGEDQPGAADRKGAEVDQVPVVGEAIAAGVLAHGGDDDAIAEREASEGDGREQHGGGAGRRCGGTGAGA